jgi:regulatory protein
VNQEKEFHELLLKAERFCSYQERTISDVKQKLKELGSEAETSEKIISSLIEDDYLNDERFAKLFTSGKFRIKRWGKNKIRAELKKKKIPDNFIYDALDSIDEEEYLKTIQRLAEKKSQTTKGKNSKDKLKKVVMFLLSRGFESEMIWKVLKGESI